MGVCAMGVREHECESTRLLPARQFGTGARVRYLRPGARRVLGSYRDAVGCARGVASGDRPDARAGGKDRAARMRIRIVGVRGGAGGAELCFLSCVVAARCGDETQCRAFVGRAVQ